MYDFRSILTRQVKHSTINYNLAKTTYSYSGILLNESTNEMQLRTNSKNGRTALATFRTRRSDKKNKITVTLFKMHLFRVSKDCRCAYAPTRVHLLCKRDMSGCPLGRKAYVSHGASDSCQYTYILYNTYVCILIPNFCNLCTVRFRIKNNISNFIPYVG